MNDKVENLVLEQLRAIRGDLARMSDRIDGLAIEVRYLRQQFAAQQTLVERNHDDVAGLKVRLDRIERRLDLVDKEPAE